MPENKAITNKTNPIFEEWDRSLNRFALWRWLKEVSVPIYLFFITRIFIMFAVYCGVVLFAGMRAAYAPGSFTDNVFLSSWARWDTGQYAIIIDKGYQEFASAAFFPLYPFLCKLVNIIVQDSSLSAIIVSNISFLVALIFLYKLVKLKFNSEDLAERTVFYLSIFPTAFFYISGLTESTFLMLSVLTFYFAEKNEWQLAGLFGILVSATRSTGFLIIVPIGLIYLWKKKYELNKIDMNILSILLIPLGILLYMCVLMFYGRPPLDFITAGQQAWPRIFAWPWWDLSRSISMLMSFPLYSFLMGEFPIKLLIGVLLICIVAILSIVSVYRLDVNYGVYSLLLTTFFLSNPAKEWQLYGDLRYIVVIFPVFILMAYYGKHKLVNYLVVTISLLLLGILAVYNGMGGWIS